LDGDADRLIYFYFDEKNNFVMLDGDKIAVLMADHLRGLIKEAGIEGLTVGLVQSAYANGSSTDYASNTLVSCLNFDVISDICVSKYYRSTH